VIQSTLSRRRGDEITLLRRGSEMQDDANSTKRGGGSATSVMETEACFICFLISALRYCFTTCRASMS
jgi:hypothetical protein